MRLKELYSALLSMYKSVSLQPEKNHLKQTDMDEKEIEQLELTEKTVPKAVGYLINEVAEMRATLDKMEKQLGLGINKHRPILMEQAAEILQMKVGTVKRLVDERNIPHYKREHNIYFFEDELIKWIEESKVKMASSYTYFRR